MATTITTEIKICTNTWGEVETFTGTVLGKGRYCVAYRLASGDVLIRVKPGECGKEAIALFAHASPHVPEIARVGSGIGRLADYSYYRMPYYDRLTPKRMGAWAWYKELAALLETARKETYDQLFPFPTHPRKGNYDHMCYVNTRLVELVQQSATLPDSLKECIDNLAYVASMYGSSVTFEFAPRNLGVAPDGMLILRDVLYDAATI